MNRTSHFCFSSSELERGVILNSKCRIQLQILCYPINSDFVQRVWKAGTGCLSDDDVDGSLAIDAVLGEVGSFEGDLWEDVHVSTLRKWISSRISSWLFYLRKFGRVAPGCQRSPGRKQRHRRRHLRSRIGSCTLGSEKNLNIFDCF